MEHFKAFVHQMEKRGVDLSKVSISKASASLWGAPPVPKVKEAKLALSHIPRDGIRSLRAVMQMTPIYTPEGDSFAEEEARQARRREILYGRPPSEKAKKSLDSVIEIDEPPEPEEGKPAFLH